MAESLLAGLHTRFKCTKEDVATLSLHYILSTYKELNEVFNRLLSDSLGVEINSNTMYSCQQSGDDKERPDMSGFDSEGNEIVVCEMKFYADLTENQPKGYINRLNRTGGKALVFICPENRRTSLWAKITELCEEQNLYSVEDNGYRVIVDGITMTIITWGKIIESLRLFAPSEASNSDINQLAGFCEMMDSTAFIPFTPEDLQPMVARKEERHYRIIDEEIEKLKTINNRIVKYNDKWKAGPCRGGYSRKIIIDGYYVILIYDRNIWMENSTVDTPFWLYIADETNWVQSERLKNKFSVLSDPAKYYMKYTDEKCPSALYNSKFKQFYIFALYPMIYATLDEVVKDIMKQILERVDSIK